MGRVWRWDIYTHTGKDGELHREGKEDTLGVLFQVQCLKIYRRLQCSHSQENHALHLNKADHLHKTLLTYTETK